MTNNEHLALVTAIATLTLIATPKRPDGTYNRDREACEQMAKETLKRINDLTSGENTV
jgi:hypothetical protein